MRALLILIVLTGCAAVDHEAINIVWHRAEAKEASDAYVRVYGKPSGRAALGFYYWDGAQCHVYAPDTSSKSGVLNGDMDTLGHEVKHCFDGLFHGGTENPRNTRSLSGADK